jgi:hypothetical protein
VTYFRHRDICAGPALQQQTHALSVTVLGRSHQSSVTATLKLSEKFTKIRDSIWRECEYQNSALEDSVRADDKIDTKGVQSEKSAGANLVLKIQIGTGLHKQTHTVGMTTRNGQKQCSAWPG